MDQRYHCGDIIASLLVTGGELQEAIKQSLRNYSENSQVRKTNPEKLSEIQGKIKPNHEACA